jgi:hypothetical protein
VQHALETQMEEVQTNIMNKGSNDEIALKEENLKEYIEVRVKQEEIIWRKKSRIKWLKGDRNYEFFHNSMINHRHYNKFILVHYKVKMDKHWNTTKALKRILDFITSSSFQSLR